MKKHINDIISVLLILLFVYTGMSKLLEYSLLKNQIAQSPLIGAFASVAWILPVAELIAAGLLTSINTRIYGLYASLLLLIVFTGYIGYMLAFAEHLPCSCGGVLKQLSWKQHIMFNLFFLLLALAGIVLERKQKISYWIR